MPASDFIPTTGRTQATQDLYNNLVKDVRRMLAVLGSNKTIASGAITVTPSAGDGAYKVDTESSAAEDDLDTINGGAAGDIIVLNSVNAARFVRIRSGVGNILIPNSLYIDLHPSLGIKLRYDGTNWVMDLPFLGAGYIVLTNKSGGTVNAGDVVIWDKNNASAFTTTTSASDRRVCGVVKSGQIANNAAGIVAIGGTVETVNVQGNVSIGNALITSTTVKRAAANGGTRQYGMVGFALTAYSGGGAGTVSAYLQPDSFLFANSVTWEGYQATTSGTITLDAGTNSNRLLMIYTIDFAGDSTPDTFTVTVNGNAVTNVYTSSQFGQTTMIVNRYTNPNTGNNTISVSRSQNGGQLDSFYTVAIALSNVNQTTPVRTPGFSSSTSTGPTATGTGCTAGDYIQGVYFAQNSNTGEESALGSGQSSDLKVTTTGLGANGLISVSHKTGTGASENMSATLTSSRLWLAFAVGIQPA